jgi:hypothetical protein
MKIGGLIKQIKAQENLSCAFFYAQKKDGSHKKAVLNVI